MNYFVSNQKISVSGKSYFVCGIKYFARLKALEKLPKAMYL